MATITGQVGPFKITRQFNRRDAEKARGGHSWATRIRLQGPMGEEYQQSSEILESCWTCSPSIRWSLCG